MGILAAIVFASMAVALITTVWRQYSLERDVDALKKLTILNFDPRFQRSRDALSKSIAQSSTGGSIEGKFEYIQLSNKILEVIREFK